MERKEIIRWMMLALILVAITMQIRVYHILKTKAQLMEEPAMYAARVYNIDYCACKLSTQSTLIFNKTSSIIETKRGTETSNDIDIDWGNLLNVGDTNGTNRST